VSFVTGLGCVSPVGNTVAESWANLLAGSPALTSSPSSMRCNFACKFAGEVKGFSIGDYIPEKEARHMDRFIHLGLAAPSRLWPTAVCPRVMPSAPSGHTHRLQHRRGHRRLADD
jgi:3-oxoacyl-(acyl-carrier-protein) synthase